VRCFIGIPMPQTYQQGLERLVDRVRPGLRSRMSWTKPGNWHLTVKFLGEVDEILVEDIKTALSGVRFARFAIRAGSAGYFPNIRRPRVLWVGLSQGADQCSELFVSVEQALEPLGIEPDDHPFRSHLTLARIRQNKGDDWEELLKSIRSQPWGEFVCDELVLWKSDLGPHGPTYARLMTRKAES